MVRFFCTVALCVTLILARTGTISAQSASFPDTTSASAADRSAIETIVREYLLRNPAVVREALDSLRVQDEAAAAARVKTGIENEREQLLHDPESPWTGSADPDVTIVEFFDYHCGFCKQMAPTLSRLTTEDPKVRIVLKNFPILGQESLEAARASLAARKEGAFEDFHEGMISSPALTAADVRRIASERGLAATALAKADLPEIQRLVDANMRLAGVLGINATPSFVIGEKVIQGAIGYEQLKAMVAEERAKSAR